RGLAASHTLRLTDRRPFDYASSTSDSLPNPNIEFALAELGADASTNLLVRGMDAIVHVAEPLPGEPPAEYLDTMTRRTYNLLMAASAEGVSRVVYLSSLRLMAAYGPQYMVTERWRPRPTTDVALLGKHLGEMVCREFAREFKLHVTVLRLGEGIEAGPAAERAGAGAGSLGEPNALPPMAVSAADVVQAVNLALARDLGRWAVIHIQSEFPGAQFPVGDAKRLLGFAPSNPSQAG
ncbi:MAG TPA: NAD(P)-dependent oxidoreductase, partial [Caldilineaceae bacterium]|nr:NAD(P)-dependent oxidoreductase [Caldilineaceae bacterium]